MLLSLREYARLRGVSAAAVSQAIKDKRLLSCLTTDHRGKPKIISRDLADLEWAKNTDASKVPVSVVAAKAAAVADKNGTAVGGVAARLVDQRARREAAQAELAEFKLAKLRGDLVSVKAIEAAWIAHVVAVRTRLLAVPAKVKARRSDLTYEDVRCIDEQIREALEALANGAPNIAAQDVAPADLVAEDGDDDADGAPTTEEDEA